MTIFDLKTGKNGEKMGENVAFARNFTAYGMPDVADLIRKAIDYRLLHREILREFTYDQICEEYNGIGPDRWPQELRDILSWLLQDILEAVLIHDMDYAKGGSRKQFFAANKALGDNVRHLANKKYHWWNARRYFLRIVATKMEQLTNEFGWDGWNKPEPPENQEEEVKNEHLG